MIKNLDRTDWTFDELENFGFSPFKYYIYSSNFGGFLKAILPDKIMDKIFTKIEMVSDCCMVKDNYRVMIDEMNYIDGCYFTDNNKKIEILYSGRRNVSLGDLINPIKEHKRNLTLDKILV